MGPKQILPLYIEQCRPRIDGNEEILYNLQISRTVASPSNAI